VKLGRYEVVRELGKGAMGIVYLAKDPLIGRLVALKTIRPAAHADEDETKEFQQRFIREAQAAGILNHPSIVTVFDIGDDGGGTSFIAMEYVDGQNLKEVLSQGRPLTFEQIADIVSQVAEAIDFAHSKGIVHRDVKPANIILLEGMKAKITDFGIAKIASGGANLTSTGQFLGTPNYMAPEQIKGSPVDGRTDIFSLGICLYECLTRRKPFGGDSLTAISYKIVHEPFPPLLEVNPQIPEGFQDVVALCLAKEPAKRYQRGKDLASALRSVMRGERPVRQPDPMFSDSTIITRDREKIPTIEIPFPDADVSVAETPAGPFDTNPKPAATTPPSSAKARVARPRPDPAAIVRKTLTNVRAHPVWKQRMHPALFIGIIALLAVPLLATVMTLRAKRAKIPPVDTRAEVRRATERRLREEGNQLLRQGRVGDAYARFDQLQKMAPGSPAIRDLMQKLDSIRQQEAASKQKFTEARQKFDQGVALYTEKKYSEAIPFFEQSVQLNQNSEEAAQYLKLAQQEEQRERTEKIARAKVAQQQRQQAQPAPAPVVTLTRTPSPLSRSPQTVTPQPSAATSPAQLIVYFNSPVADGTIIVKVGSDVIAHENLWEIRGPRIFGRRGPHVVNVTKEITPKNTDVEITVEIPTLQVHEHHVMTRQVFQPGAAHKLTVSFDPNSKLFVYQLN
jgi:serine/threonine protein kinase/septum formation inhibitor MinC